jgi:TRAP-type C4-dicarboxylate transport system permease large subunit
MILYAVAAEQSLGRLFLGRHRPWHPAGGAVRRLCVYRYRKEYATAKVAYQSGGTERRAKSAMLDDHVYTMAEKVEMLPRVVPFVVLLIGVMVALYGGYATPSETAGLGGILALVLIAVVYGIRTPKQLQPILSSTIKESTMLMFIIGMSLLYSYVMSSLHISQDAAQAVVAMHLPKWLLLATILVMVVVLGFFLPPVSIILMTAPIVLPPLKTRAST